jgi:predicted DNA-binding protein (UPF0278 family)|tara:strand:- start:4856 stop:5227 length:372 start_codon:yes stop_codon:yes gene_type:complete
MTIHEKLKKLKSEVFTPEYQDESKDFVARIEKQVTEDISKQQALEMVGIQMLLEFLENETKQINRGLQMNEDMSEEARKLVFEKRRWNHKVLSLFISNLESLEQTIDRNLEEISDTGTIKYTE